MMGWRGEQRRPRWWFHRCDTCDVITLPFVLRWLGPSTWALKIRLVHWEDLRYSWPWYQLDAALHDVGQAVAKAWRYTVLGERTHQVRHITDGELLRVDDATGTLEYRVADSHLEDVTTTRRQRRAQRRPT